MDQQSSPRPFPPPIGDPLIDERLTRLAARTPRRSGPGSGPPTEVPPARRTARAHAARGSRRAALALSVTTTLGLAGYLQQASAATDTTDAEPAASISVSATPAATSAETATAETATAVTTEAAATTGVDTSTVDTSTVDTSTVESTAAAVEVGTVTATYADGTFTGDTFTNRWGPVQVEVTVSGGQIAEVTVLQYPDDDRKSVQINQRALPTLIQSTLSTQSAEVDSVSGATYTSEGYQQSLQTALDAARAAVSA